MAIEGLFWTGKSYFVVVYYMGKAKNIISALVSALTSAEALLQLAMFVILQLFTAFGKPHPHIHFWEVMYSVNKVSVAMAINYYLLPRYFYTKKYIQFIAGIIILTTAAVFIEEFIFEGLFYSNIRESYFPEIFYRIGNFLPTILLFVGFKFAWDARNKQAELEKLKSAVSESELQFLKSQINPHFLFNNLNNLYAHALDNSAKTPTIILELSSLLRYMLYDCREKLVPLEKEFKYLRDFVHLQELQIGNKGKINFETAGNTDGKFIAPLILIAFVENCFKHSTSSQTNEIRINIYLKIENHNLSLYCTNSFSSSSNLDELSRGIGLGNVQSRLDLLYPNAHSLEINSENGLYKVNLDLNLTDTIAP